MKLIEKTEKVEHKVTYYVAEDGTEFKHSYDCEKYEMTILEEKLAGITQCKAREDYPPFDGGDHSEWCKYRWVYPRDENDIELLNELFGGIGNDDIGEWLCIEDTGDDFYVTPLKNSTMYATKLLDGLGYEITISKKGEFQP